MSFKVNNNSFINHRYLFQNPIKREFITKTPSHKEVIGITVSVNYDDYLSLILTQNAKLLKEWYIVTSEEDFRTINLVKESKLENIKLLYYNFKNNGMIFDKGGALKMVQEEVLKIYKDQSDINILILDSDIYLPENFEECLSKLDIVNEVLYGAIRFDYRNPSDFIKNENGVVFHDLSVVGYFQLYSITNQKFYERSKNCGQCDVDFNKKFLTKYLIPGLIVKHIGQKGVNWDGRKSHRI